VTFFYAP